jgi:hypothetical protein
MSLRAQRGNRTEVELCKVCGCFVPRNDMFTMGVMLSLSKHGGQGLGARPFDKLRVTGPPA